MSNGTGDIGGSNVPDTVDVTIALLTRNAAELLPRLLDAVAAQHTTRRVELLAIDSGSMDGTVSLLEERAVRVIQIPERDFDWGLTRELAFKEARGSIVVNLSQDAIPAGPDWLDNLLEPLTDPEVGASCGTSLPDPERHFPQFPWERNGYFYFTREMRKYGARYGRGLSFANAAVPRTIWERFHFDAQVTGEDFQFQTKMHTAGLRVAFPANAPVLHHHNYSLPRLFKRCRNEGMALRHLGCPYTELDLVADIIGPRQYVQWLREVRHGRLSHWADVLFPLVRPLAVYTGSRFARKSVWY